MSRPTAIVFLWLAAVLAAGGWIWRAIEVDHDLLAFLPDRDRPVETLLMSRANSGSVARLVLIAFAGGSLEQRLAASREAAAVLQETPGVEQVANGAQPFDTNAFEPLFPYRYLLGQPLPDDTAGLHAALKERLKELRSPLSTAAKQDLDIDPTATFRKLLLRWAEGSKRPEREDGLWVTPDRARVLLLASLAETSGDGGQEAVRVAAIREALGTIADRQGIELLLAGRPALAAEAQDSIRSSFVNGGLVASVLLVALLLWLYRSFGVLLLGILPLASGMLAGLVAVLGLFGAVHAIALAFGVTLLGIAIDYPLHLFSHHRQGTRLSTTARSIQRPLFLGALTTAGAFTIFGTGSTPGLGQLACFASVGVLTAAFTLRYVVPALAELTGTEPRLRRVDLLPAVAPRAVSSVIVVIALAAAVMLFTRAESPFASDISVLNPLPDAAKQRDRRMRADIGAPDLRHLVMIDADDAETVLQRAETLVPHLENLAAAGDIAGFDAPSRYLPSLARQLEVQAGLMPKEAFAATVAEAAEGLPFKAGLFDPFQKAVEGSRTLAPLSAEAGLALFASTPLGAKLEQLLLQVRGRWYGVLPLSDVADVTEIQALTASIEGAELVDLKALTDDILISFRQEALTLMTLGLVAALVVLGVLRYPLAGLVRILFVLSLALFATAAILALTGELLTMMHILAALLVIGLGIDYTVFFSWPAVDDEQRRRTRQALIACLLSTVLVFGLLAGSSIGVLSAIGLTVAIGACTTFALTYAILSRQHG